MTPMEAAARRHETFAEWWRLAAARHQLPLVAVCCPEGGDYSPFLVLTSDRMNDVEAVAVLREAVRRMEERLGAR